MSKPKPFDINEYIERLKATKPISFTPSVAPKQTVPSIKPSLGEEFWQSLKPQTSIEPPSIGEEIDPLELLRGESVKQESRLKELRETLKPKITPPSYLGGKPSSIMPPKTGTDLPLGGIEKRETLKVTTPPSYLMGSPAEIISKTTSVMSTPAVKRETAKVTPSSYLGGSLSEILPETVTIRPEVIKKPEIKETIKPPSYLMGSPSEIVRTTGKKEDIIDRALRGDEIAVKELEKKNINPEFIKKYPTLTRIMFDITKPVADVLDTLGQFHFLNRVAQRSVDVVTGNFDSKEEKPSTKNIILDFAADLLGTITGFSVPGGIGRMASDIGGVAATYASPIARTALSKIPITKIIPDISSKIPNIIKTWSPSVEDIIRSTTAGAILGAGKEAKNAKEMVKNAIEEATMFLLAEAIIGGAFRVAKPYMSKAWLRARGYREVGDVYGYNTGIWQKGYGTDNPRNDFIIEPLTSENSKARLGYLLRYKTYVSKYPELGRILLGPEEYRKIVPIPPATLYPESQRLEYIKQIQEKYPLKSAETGKKELPKEIVDILGKKYKITEEPSIGITRRNIVDALYPEIKNKIMQRLDKANVLDALFKGNKEFMELTADTIAYSISNDLPDVIAKLGPTTEKEAGKVINEFIEKEMHELLPELTTEEKRESETIKKAEIEAETKEVKQKPEEQVTEQAVAPSTSELQKKETKFNIGDRITWQDSTGQILTGTIRDISSDGKLEVKIDQESAVGGVSIGRVEMVSPDRPDLQKIEEGKPVEKLAEEEKAEGTVSGKEETIESGRELKVKPYVQDKSIPRPEEVIRTNVNIFANDEIAGSGHILLKKEFWPKNFLNVIERHKSGSVENADKLFKEITSKQIGPKLEPVGVMPDDMHFIILKAESPDIPIVGIDESFYSFIKNKLKADLFYGGRQSGPIIIVKDNKPIGLVAPMYNQYISNVLPDDVIVETEKKIKQAEKEKAKQVEEEKAEQVEAEKVKQAEKEKAEQIKGDKTEISKPTEATVKPSKEKVAEVKPEPKVKPRTITIDKVKVSTVKMKDGSTMVKLESPYHPDLPSKARDLGGRWNPSKKAWYFDIRDEERVKELAQSIYGTRGEGEEVPVVDVLVKLDDLGKAIYDSQLFLFDREIASRRYRDSKVRLGDKVVVIEGGFPSSGVSKKYPSLSPEGGTILEIRDVPLILVEKADFPVEIVEGHSYVEEKEERREEGATSGHERRGDTGKLQGTEVEGKSEEVLGKTPAENVQRVEKGEEIRGDTEQSRGERHKDEGQVLSGPSRTETHRGGERHPKEDRDVENVRHDGRGTSESTADLSAAREGLTGQTVGKNFVITAEEEKEILEGGPVTRARNNIEAIKILKQLEEEGRLATVEEQRKLVKYSGWGTIYQIFQPWKISEYKEYKTWCELNDELKKLLTNEEYDVASRVTQYAYYTSPEVIKEMWNALKRFGFDGGRILEPAIGSGLFFGLMPEDIASKSSLTGIEIDKISGKIAKYLYPEANIYVQGFETTTLPNDFFDIAISNVPFGDVKIFDPSYPKYLTNYIHNYFFAKTIDKIRPGGIIMFISSTGTMDSRTNKEVREYLANKADFIGAIRLPSGTFRKIARTDVATDIIILKKRAEGQELSGESWIESKESGIVSKTGKPLYINEYYIRHPEMIIGKLTEDKLHPDRLGVEQVSEEDTIAKLRNAFAQLPENIYEKIEIDKGPRIHEDIQENKPSMEEGSFIVKDGDIYQNRKGNLVKITKNKEKIKAFIDIRDAAVEVLSIQYNEKPDEELEEAQNKLNKLYDAFVGKYGYISESSNTKLIKDDPSFYLLRGGLEIPVKDPKTGKIVKYKKSDIFTTRTIRGFKQQLKAETAKEAMLISLNEEGRVNLERITELTGKSEKEILKELDDIIYKNPDGEQWETAEQYLSGNVREKLRIAEAAAEIDSQYKKNVEALKKVQPKDLDPHEISITLGTPWIPAKYIEKFIGSHILDLYGDKVKVTKNPVTSSWKVEVEDRYAYSSAKNITTWGTVEVPATKLIEMSLNKKIPTIYTKETDQYGKEIRQIDQKATNAAREKQIKLEEEFRNWFWSDPERAKEWAAKYNEMYNNLRLTVYNGSHLTFPGMNSKIELHPHQKNAVWRIISSNKNALIAHGVGKGKSFVIAASIMELRRLGIAKKPIVVLPRSTFEQFVEQFYTLYPKAKILTITSDDLPPAEITRRKDETEEAFNKRREQNIIKRKAILSRIVTGDWDAVITTQEIFTRLPVSPEWEKSFLERELRELRAIYTDMRRDPRGKGKTIKQIEKDIQNYETKIKTQLSKIKRDMVMPFEELGIDWLFVDEAHAYKKLPVNTKMSNISGVPTGSSQRAFDMYLKTQWITKINNGKGVVFATGTPITNTMAEVYNLQRYLAYDQLEKLNLIHFDDWATMFGVIQTSWEISADGRTYQPKTSFSKFVNVPELMKLFRDFADVMLNEPDDPGVPKLKGDKRTIVTVEPSPEQEQLIHECVERLESFKQGHYDPKVDNPLKVCVDGQKIALDPRLVDPSLPENPNSKVNIAVGNIFDIWKKTSNKRSTQIVFLDLSVPKSSKDIEVEMEEEEEDVSAKIIKENIIIYKEIKKKLMSLGVPENEIAFIHEFKTKAQKKKLNEMMNEGQIRILIGSTGKMGLGLNIQQKLIALHHIDCPWRPDELEQREGRILRPGNENEEVEIFVYGTERSFDTMRWNKVARKAKFIRQLLVSDENVRDAEDVDEVVLSYEEAKAAVSGNPLVEEKFKVDSEVNRLQMSRIAFLENKRSILLKIEQVKDTIEQRQTFLEKLRKDLEIKQDVKGNKFKINILEKTYTDKKEADKALLEALEKSPRPKKGELFKRTKIGSFAGFKLYIQKGKINNYWELEGHTSYSKEITMLASNISAMVREIGSISNKISQIKEELNNLNKELIDLEKEKEKTWEGQEKLNELLIRQRKINQELGIIEKTEEEIEIVDETYSLPELDTLRNKADIVLMSRIKGLPEDEDIYSLPIFAPQKTSIRQVARGLKIGVEKGIFKKGMTVVDVGGGLYDDGTIYLAEHGITNLVYDPYARTEEHNNSIINRIKATGGVDAVALNNVLNVIPEAGARRDVIKFAYGLLKNGSQMVITVYEGNRSGKGSMKEFKDGTYTWQENRRLESYTKEIREAIPNAQIDKKYGAFIITKPLDERDYNTLSLAEKKKIHKAITVKPSEEPIKLSPKATRKIIEKFTKALNTAARSTRMGIKHAKKRAFYEKGAHAIRSKEAYFNQWRSIGHEVGHAFYTVASFHPDLAEMAQIAKKYYPAKRIPAKRMLPEGYAEFFMLWFADNETARKLAPKTTHILEKYLASNPEIKEIFEQAQVIAEEDLLGTPLERMRHLTIRRGERLAPSEGEYEVPWWQKLTFRLVDGSIPLRDLYEEASKKGYEGLDPAKLYAISALSRDRANQLFIGKPRFKYGNFVLPGKRSLLEIAQEAEKKMPNGSILFNDIYKALRYQERAEKGFVTPYPKEELDAAVEQARKEYPDIVKLAEEFAETLSEINLRLLVAGKVISEATADRIRKGSKYYFPLYYPAKSRGIQKDPLRSSGPGVLRYRGHTAQTLDFVEASLLRLHDTLLSVEINRIMHAIEESLRMPEMGRFGVITEKPTIVKSIRLSTLTKQIEDNFLGELDPDDPERIVKIFMPGLESDLKKSEPILVSRHGDEQVFMHVAPDLFESIQSLQPPQYNWVAKTLAQLALVSRFGALTNIRYITNNFVRDLFTAAIQTKTTYENSFLRGYLESALIAAGYGEKAKEIFDLFIQSGGYGASVMETLNSIRRSVSGDRLIPVSAPGWKKIEGGFARIVNTPLDAIRILEEIPKIAEFEAVLKKELSELNLTIEDVVEGKVPEELTEKVEKALVEAAYASREVNVNFGLHGTSRGWRMYVSTVPFLQGSIQGIYRTFRQIKTNPGDTMKRWLIYILPLTLLAWALSRKRDKYRDMPSEARDRYWWFPVGDFTFIALAKPYEYALPANILERLLDWLANSNDPNRRKPLEDLIDAVRQAFSVELTSMVVQTILQLMTNKTYSGSPIVPQREMQVSPEYRYGPETKKVSIKLAQIAARFMGEKAPSPRQIDYFMKGIFGGAGETILDILSLPLSGPGSEKRAGIEYIPIIGPLIYGFGEGGSRIVDKFYKDYERAQKLYNNYRLHGKKLSEEDARLVMAIPAMRAIANDLAGLRKELREIEMSSDYTPEDKRKARLRYNWISRVAAGFLYGAPVPGAPAETDLTEAHVQDILRHYETLTTTAVKNALKKPGGPL